MSITIRQARIDDVASIIPFIKIASGGITEYLLNDIIPGVSPDELIEMALLDETTTLYVDNILVAEQEGDIIAAVNFYQSEAHCLPNIMKALIPDEKMALIIPYIESSVENSMYIHTLAVDEKYRYSSVGLELCKQVEKNARLNQKKCLSAHVFFGNDFVFRGLVSAGFKVVQTIKIPKDPSFYYQSDMALMQGPDI